MAADPTPRTPRPSRPLAGRWRFAAALVAAALAGAVAGPRVLPPAAAQSAAPPASGGQEPGTPANGPGPAPTFGNGFGVSATVARQQIADVLRRTNSALTADPTGDIDRDLAEKIVAFHQSSIDLAQIVLELGEDPELRRLAVLSLQAESRAVADIRTWLNNRELVRRQSRSLTAPATPGGRP